MGIPQRRIAITVLVVLLIACAAAWWWQKQDATRPGATVADAALPAAHAPGKADARAPASREMTAADDPCGQEMAVLRSRRFEALGHDDVPEAVIGRALLEPGLRLDVRNTGTRPLLATDAELASATRAFPRNPDIAWYHANRCLDDDHCDPGQAIAHLLTVEPDNLAGWLLAARAAQRDGDEAGVQAALEAAAQADAYDPRMADVVLRLHAVLEDLPLPASCNTPAFRRAAADVTGSGALPTPSELATVMAIAVAAAHAPAYGSLRNACIAPGAVLPPARLTACRGVFSKIADGDTLIDQSIGVSMMMQLTAGTREHADWTERQRQLRWLLSHQPELDAGAAAAMRRWRAGEVRTMQKELGEKGLWPPPAR